METRAQLAQHIIFTNSNFFVEYLKNLSASYDLLEDAFDVDKAVGRVFFPDKKGVPFNPAIDKTLTSPDILYEFQKRFLSLFAQKENENYKLIKDTIVDFFFTPIEKNPEWKLFWAEEQTRWAEKKAKKASSTQLDLVPEEEMDDLFASSEIDLMPAHLIENNPADEQIAPEMKRLRDHIAGAFCYKILALWVEENPVLQQQFKAQISSFTSIISSIGNDLDIFEAKRTKLIAKIANGKVKELNTHIKNLILAKKENEIFKDVKEAMSGARKTDYYQELITECEKILYQALVELIKNMPKKHKYPAKKTAEAVLSDLNGKYKRELLDKTLPPYLKDVIEALKPYIGGKVSKACSLSLDYIIPPKIKRNASAQTPPSIKLTPSDTPEILVLENNSNNASPNDIIASPDNSKAALSQSHTSLFKSQKNLTGKPNSGNRKSVSFKPANTKI